MRGTDASSLSFSNSPCQASPIIIGTKRKGVMCKGSMHTSLLLSGVTLGNFIFCLLWDFLTNQMRLTIPTAQIVMIERIKIPFSPAPPGVDPWLILGFLHLPLPPPAFLGILFPEPLPVILPHRTSLDLSLPMRTTASINMVQRGPSHLEILLRAYLEKTWIAKCLVILYLKSRWKVKSVTNPWKEVWDNEWKYRL